jgi:hypothetical protein
VATGRAANERLDVVLKHSFQNKAVINRKTVKSTNAADWKSIPHRLTTERFFCIPISGNTGVGMEHFNAESGRECHWINLKMSAMYAQKCSFVIIFMPNRKLQNHFFGTGPNSRDKDVWILIWRSLLPNDRDIINKMDGKTPFSCINLFSLSIVIYFHLYLLYSLLFSRK